MTKRQIIDEISRYNTTAKPQFLLQFNEQALSDYLKRLVDLQRRHVRIGGRVKDSRRLQTTVLRCGS